MTKKELIDALSKYPDDMEVGVERDASLYCDGGVYIVEGVIFDEERNLLIIDA